MLRTEAAIAPSAETHSNNAYCLSGSVVNSKLDLVVALRIHIHEDSVRLVHHYLGIYGRRPNEK